VRGREAQRVSAPATEQAHAKCDGQVRPVHAGSRPWGGERPGGAGRSGWF